MKFDQDLGVDPDEPVRLLEEHRQLVQKWIDEGATLNGILYTLSGALTSTLAQCGAPRAKIERLHRELLMWINSTDTMQEARGRNRHERRAAKKSKPH